MTTLRVSKAAIPSELRESMIKPFGAVAEPVEVTWHNPKVAQAALEFGAKIAAWDAADESLKTFAHMAVAAQVGCSWCLQRDRGRVRRPPRSALHGRLRDARLGGRC
jgi:alkylhydroperoxidase family enzyme